MFRQNASADAGLLIALVFAASAAVVVILSLLAEALRRKPAPPAELRWAPGIPIMYAQVNGHRIRYIKVGNGPTLVLLHTLRTQLDLFEKVVEKLARQFTVYALDYPGHGYSDIPDVNYDAGFFAGSVEGFLDALALENVCLAGVSIGASISLILAARQNPRVNRVIAVNPYDYDKGRGLARSSLPAWVIMTTARIPLLGATILRLRNILVMKAVFAGGVADGRSIPPELLGEMYLVGNRRGHYQAFLSLLRNSASWEDARMNYPRITAPVLLLWGDQDWASIEDRKIERELVPNASVVTVPGSGHFLPLDRPDAFIAEAVSFCAQP